MQRKRRSSNAPHLSSLIDTTAGNDLRKVLRFRESASVESFVAITDFKMNDDAIYPERIVAENVVEAVWLHFRRLTSSILCRRMIQSRDSGLDEKAVEKKGQELAFAVRSALGYWQSQPTALNAKVLSRYYALLQISIAEQLASPASTSDLEQIQRNTESGHGLWTMAAPNGEFPENYKVIGRNRGHFFEYCTFKGLDLPFAKRARPEKGWNDLRSEELDNLVSLRDLFRRIPELGQYINQTFSVPPLAFHIGHAHRNDVERFNRIRAHSDKTGEVLFDPPTTTPKTTTYIAIYPDGQNMSVDFLSSLDLPIKNIAQDKSIGGRFDIFVGELEHETGTRWYEAIDTYKSGYCGTSYIVPLWGKVSDPFIIHFVTLYTLSIVVRYLPLLWHEIEDGRFDHIRALIEYYLAIVDNVLPQIAIERITGKRLLATQPGSLQGPA